MSHLLATVVFLYGSSCTYIYTVARHVRRIDGPHTENTVQAIEWTALYIIKHRHLSWGTGYQQDPSLRKGTRNEECILVQNK
jgi:hypothetical protein